LKGASGRSVVVERSGLDALSYYILCIARQHSRAINNTSLHVLWHMAHLVFVLNLYAKYML
jgi:hypothetical protein